MADTVDVVIIGAGFSGLAALHKTRKAGFKAVVLERAGGIGGVWYANRYPGARVDIPSLLYQYPQKELWEDWTWSEKFAAREELERYFAYVDKKWDLSKDIQLNTEVTGATFDEKTNKWTVKTKAGKQITAQWLIGALGSQTKPYIPAIPGLDKFVSSPEKKAFHTADWPIDTASVELKDKRVGVIGTGASGVQVIQTAGPIAKHLTVFQRTATQTMPLRQRDLSVSEQNELKVTGVYQQNFDTARQTPAGINLGPTMSPTFGVSPEERAAHYAKIWDIGGIAFMACNYMDFIVDKTANDEAYSYLAKKNRERITDPKKRDLLVPLKSDFSFGTKRPCLESNYYEVLDQKNTDIIDVSEKGSPILEITEKGVVTKDGLVELDVLVFATGFDAVTGGLTTIDIRGVNGLSLAEKWRQAAVSNTGISVHGFPNMFFMHGLHSPVAFANGPSVIEAQSEFITDVLTHSRDSQVVRFEATAEAEQGWTKHVSDVWNFTLLHGTKSWYQGNGIPGKNEEPLCYPGGMPAYSGAFKESKENDYKGYVQTK